MSVYGTHLHCAADYIGSSQCSSNVSAKQFSDRAHLKPFLLLLIGHFGRRKFEKRNESIQISLLSITTFYTSDTEEYNIGTSPLVVYDNKSWKEGNLVKEQ